LREAWDLFQDGTDPSVVQERINKQRRILEKYPPFPPMLKALMHRMYGLPRWAVKPPLESLSAELEKKALKELEGLQV
jgi:dihydrodipicolinate synthase/N-acetylneuraminate lyase